MAASDELFMQYCNLACSSEPYDNALLQAHSLAVCVCIWLGNYYKQAIIIIRFMFFILLGVKCWEVHLIRTSWSLYRNWHRSGFQLDIVLYSNFNVSCPNCTLHTAVNLMNAVLEWLVLEKINIIWHIEWRDINPTDNCACQNAIPLTSTRVYTVTLFCVLWCTIMTSGNQYVCTILCYMYSSVGTTRDGSWLGLGRVANL